MEEQELEDSEEESTNSDASTDMDLAPDDVKLHRHSCHVCAKTFSRMPDLTCHIKDIHRLQYIVHECDICKKRYSRKHSLKLHMDIVHLGRRDYKCDTCKKAY